MNPDDRTAEAPVAADTAPRWMAWSLRAAGIIGLIVAMRIALG